MGRSQESFNKKEVRKKKEKKRKDKEKKRLARKDDDKQSLDDMIAYVDEFGNLSSTPPDPTEKEEIDPDEIEVSVSKSTPEDEADKRHSGIVSFFNDSKGYGFIRDLDTNQSIFVHTSNTQEPISEGNRVSFEVGKGPKGPTALDVKPE
ncbi:MAG TPA: cold shock domain-containing protein [Prolixibacteraceae bacterium]|nr:cold shock domain-containing protein [Prolixibacteraceae bacterium]